MSQIDDFLSGKPSASKASDIDSFLKGTPQRTRGILETANDTVIEAANAAAGGVSSLANFVRPGNQVSSFIDKNIIKAGEEKQSDVVKSAKQTLSQGIQNADGIGGELSAVGKYVVDNPLLAASQAVGSFAVPGAAAKVLGRVGGIGAGAMMAGGDAAGTAYDLSSKAGATDAQALAAGRQASVIPALVGGVTGAFGAEKLLAGGAGFKGGIINRAVKTGLSEAGQEGIEEGITQYEGQRAAMPYDATIDPTKGVAASAGMGAIMGGATGAGVSLLTGNRDVAKAPSPTPQPEPTGEIPTPPALGYNPSAGTHTVFPDGSVILNSDQPAGEQAVFDKRYAPQPIKPSEQMGINPDAGVLSKAAAMAVDTGAHDQTLQAAAQVAQADGKSPEIAPKTPSNLIAEQAINTPATAGKAPQTSPIYGSAYAQRQATAPKVEPTDILDAGGQPFVTGFSAKRAAEAAGEGFRPFKIAEKQFVVRNFATENIADKATDTPARTSAVEATGIVSQPKENDAKTTKAIQSQAQQQVPVATKSVNAVPYENRVAPTDDSGTRPAAGSGSTVPAGVVLPERSGSDLPTRPEVVQKSDENADLAPSDLSFTTSSKEKVTGDKLSKVLNKVADDLVRNFEEQRRWPYASHVIEKQKDETLKKNLEYAKEVREGKHLSNLGIAQRINTELTGEEVSILPKSQPATQNIAAEADNTTNSDGRITNDSTAPAGSFIVDGKGKEYKVHSHRHNTLIAHPVVDGKPVVNRDSAVRFFTNQDPELSAPGDNDRRDPIFTKTTDSQPVPVGLAKMREGKAKREAASLDGLRTKAIARIAKGTAYFRTAARADEFIAANGLKDTHEFIKHASGANRWDVVAKTAPVIKAPENERVDGRPVNSKPMPELDGFKLGDAVDVPSRTIGRSKVTRLYTTRMSGFSEPLAMATVVNEEGKTLELNLSELVAPKPIVNVIQAAKDSGKLIIANAGSKIEAKPELSEKTQALNLLLGLQAKQAANSMIADDRLESQINQVKKRISSIDEANGQNDEMDAEMRSYEAKANPTYSGEPKTDALSEKEKAAKAKMLNALGKLATLASKNTRMNWTPEEEQKLLPIVIELFDGAMELGAVTFQKAVRYVRDYISKGIDQETADAIPFDTLQGAYIATSGRHKDKGVTPKKEVASFESLAELESVPEAKSTLTDTFYDAIKSGGMPKDNPALRKMVESFDGKPADNARLKEAQEELEAAIARTTRDVISKGKGQRETFDELLRLYNSQPLLNIRTSTSIANQAYSTPAPLAYLTSELAGITQNDTVLEPTGGTGMLIAGANPSKTLANELNDHRAELLRAQGFTVTQNDASNGFKGTFDKVNTNPPFGSIKDDKGNTVKVPVDGYRLGQIDHLIAARALAAMKDGGKATLILGANKVAGGISNDDLIFFNWLYGHYNVTGHFEVEGDLYARQGAGWPVRVITINGRQKSNKTSPIAGTVKRADNWSQVYEYFTDSLATSRTELNPSATTSAGSTGAVETNPSAVRANPDGQPANTNKRKPTGSTGSNGDVARTTAGAVPDRAKPAKEPVGASAGTKRLDATTAEPDRLDASGDSAGSRADKPATPAGTSSLSSGENQFQSSYIPRSSRKDEGVLIPINMKEPTQDALSKLEDAVGNIDDYAAKELGYASTKELHNALMGLQVDSVASSIYQIKQGKGVVIADQTGIGKGRQAASIIRWAVKQGHTPVFVTVKPSLFTDMYGDLADIGTNDINPFIMNGSEWISGDSGEKLFSNKPLTHKNKLSTIAATGELPTGSNALFMTYSQINVDNVQRKALTALADKAVFILDESHNAGGASATGEFITSVLGAAKGVTYLSATYAKRPDNMPLYFKTDIGQASADNEGLMNAMAAGGLPLQTVVSNNLVKAGQMFRRERSYDGVNIESKTDSSNQKSHEALSDKTTAALRAIVSADGLFHEVYVKELSKQLAKEGARAIDNAGNQAKDSVQHTEFSSVVHNFVRQMLLGLKAQSAADEAIAALKRGEKPIIAVENTMGSFLNEYAAANSVVQGGSLGSFDYRTVLSRALARTRVMTEQKANGEKVKKEIPLSTLDGLTRDAYRHAQEVIDGLDLDIPVSPIDWMRTQIQKAGYSVAEITGRSLSVDYSAAPVLSAISAQEQNDKVQTTRLFNSGKLDVLILNVAGSTGISLHASEKFTDQRQRHMIVAQPAQDINIFMQMLGRIHRTGQVKLPKYTILSVDLPTEKRPTALLSKKMKSLNANTSSNTESATSVKTADMLNKYGDQIVGQYLHDNYHLTQALGIEATTEDGEAVEDIARKATGRLALQPIAVQNAFYSEVEGQYNALMDYLNKTNQNDLEPRTFDFDAKELKQEILFEGADKNTPFGEDAIYGEYSIKAQGLPMKPDEINVEIQENLGGKTSEAHVVELGSALIKQFEGFYKTLPDGVQQETANKVLAEGKRFLQDHRIGKTFRVDINGDSFNAVVTNIRSTHKTTGNPLSLSKVQVSIAVNGALRHISVPATQFEKIEVSSIGAGYTIEQLFKEQPADQRETAKIVTGNLLAAYGEIDGTRGTIISFTKTDGTTDQGILLPKTFDFTKNTRGDFRLSTGAIALKFLQESDNKDIGRFGIRSRDNVVQVLPNGKGIAVLVPKSKLKGGKYFLDQGLIATFGDFVTSGNYMKATTEKPAEAVKALELLMKKQALYALPSMAEEAKAIADGETRFSRGQSTTSLPTTQVKSITDSIKSKWANAPEIVIAANMDDAAIPQAVRDHNDQQLSLGAQGSPEGFLYGGKVYLVADQLATPSDVMRVLFHETLGHVGLRGVFGDSLKPILQQIATMRRAEVAAKAKEYGLDITIEADRLQAAEEVLAVMAQTKPEMGFVKRAVAAIRTWLRKHGVNLRLTDSDIVANFILPARAWVQSGTGAVAGEAAFSRQSTTDTPAFKAWFGDSKVVDAQGKPQVMYHATEGDFSLFRRNHRGLHFVTPNAEWASDFLDNEGSTDLNEGAAIMPVYVASDNPFDYENSAHNELLIGKLNQKQDFGRTIGEKYRGLIESGHWETIERKDIVSAIKSLGFDGIYVEENGQKNLGIFESNQIKSATGNNGNFDASNPDIRFSQGNATTSLPATQVKSITDSIKSKWANAPEIVIAANMDDKAIPQAVRDHNDQQLSLGAQGNPEGFLYGGKVYLIADQLATPTDVMRVLFHETLGHVGLRGVFGDSLKPILQQIAAMRRAEVQAKAKEYGLDMTVESDRLQAAEEVLAVMAQTKPETGFVKRAVAAIRTWLRAHGVNLRLTDSDIIANYILPARAWVQSGKGAVAGDTAFSRGINDPVTNQKDVVGNTKDGRSADDTTLGVWAESLPLAGSEVDGRVVRSHIPNRSSIDASISNNEVLTGVRSVPLSSFDYMPGKLDKRTLDLAEEIKKSKEINPLIVGVDAKGVYIIEGGHRLDALIHIGAKELPALVVIDRDEVPNESTAPNSDGAPQYSRSIGETLKNSISEKLNKTETVITGQTSRQYSADQLAAMKSVGFQVETKSLAERAKTLWHDAGKKMAQGIADQFAPVKALDGKAYGLLRLSKGASGAFETFLKGGQLKISDGVYDFDDASKGGVIDQLLTPLQGEHHDFMRWVAANRAERLKGEGKENLFTDADIKALKTLQDGQTSFDYTVKNGIRKGQVTRNRAEIYRDSLATFNGFNKNILDMAEQSGLIDGDSRKLWEKEFYVPFYRVADEDSGGVRGMNIKGGVMRQQAFKELKGGKNALNADLLDNTLMNWAHLLDASAKNRAAKATIDAAEKMGIASTGDQAVLAQMGASINNKNGVVWFMDGGQKRYSLIDNEGDGPYLMTALTALEYAGMRNPVMNAMGAFKHALTVGVTASPFFKIRNLIRDSVQVIGTSGIGANPAKNIAQGWKLTNPKSDAYFRLLAGGGTIHFGTMMEGSEAKRVQSLVEAGVDGSTILDSDKKVQAFYRKFIAPGVDAYNELGNRGEAVNRAALYDQLVKAGMNHAEASLQARDLMDFSMQGSFTTIRFLSQVVPFFNARIQGMYKLGRSAKENPARFSAVIGVAAVISIILLAAYGDDEDWKKREEWDRNNFWWFKFGGTAFRIPKPFEIGAVATLAERGFELAFDKEMTGKRFGKQVMTLLGDNLSMNPVPQMVKPIMDVYANKNSFNGQPIETMSMERLQPEYRFSGRTSMLARGMSTAANAITGLVGADAPSPVQIDHMLRGYFGWLGSFVVGAGDMLARPATGQAEQATPDYWKWATGNIASDLRDAPSRYVSQMYAQAKELEQIYGTWKTLIKEGKQEEAKEFFDSNREALSKYKRVEHVKSMESKLNQQIKMIEQSDASGDDKRERIRQVQIRKNKLAESLAV